MKKIVSRIVVMIICVVTAMTAFVGCDWITTNVDEDMKQVVATVKVNDKVDAENVTKKEITAGYLSYGYQYVQSYGYTESRAYTIIYSNLVNNRIIIQTARTELAEKYAELKGQTTKAGTFEDYFKNNTIAGTAELDPKNGSVENLEKYLSEYAVLQAKYAVRQSINSMIDSFAEEEEDEELDYEDVTFTARTTPTEETASDLKEWELGNEEKAKPTEEEYLAANVTLKLEDAALKNLKTKMALNKAVAEKYEVDYDGKGRAKAYASLVKSLKKSGLIASNEKANADSEFEYSYFEELYKAQLESALVSRYEDSLIAGVEAVLNGTDAAGKTDYSALWNQYCSEYEYQYNNYANDVSAYETALDAASDTSFVLANPFVGATEGENLYGYVLNLLIGFTDEQTEAYSTYSSKQGVTVEQKYAYRNELLNSVVAKDQRESWVKNSYGEYAESAFTFADKYFNSAASKTKLGKYLGTVSVKNAEGYEVEEDNGVMTKKWNYTEVTPTALKFSDFYAQYVTAMTGMDEIHYESTTNNVGVLTDYATKSEEINDALKDLMFAFSTDTGCLGKTYGYLSTPTNSSYVEEFKNAAKDVVKAGEGAYTIVATDYGYHIILCTKKVKDEYKPDASGSTVNYDKFIADIENENTLAYKYKKAKVDAVVDSEISKKANKLVSVEKAKDGVVTYNYRAISDLIEKDDFNTMVEG